VRWDALFDDLEAQLEAEEAAEFAGELADRARREAALIRLIDRLRPALGHPVRVGGRGGGEIAGRLLAVGPDWLLLEETAAREVVVPLAAVNWVSGLGAASRPPGSGGQVAARLDLRYVLRGLARDRSLLRITFVDGGALSGTADRVGADFVEVAELPPGELRRRSALLGVRTVPLAGIAAVRRVG
jgi:hypothetical protein